VQQAQPEAFLVFEDQNLKIEMTSEGHSGQDHHIKAWFTNKNMQGLSAVNLQVAVQKYMTLKLQQISSSDVMPGPRTANQLLSISNQQEGAKPLALRIKVGYNCGGQPISEVKTINGLPNFL
jgi:AP-1 complex subunit gamma-1